MGKSGGSIVSAWLVLLCLLEAAHAEARKSIEAALDAHLASRAALTAQREGWRQHRLQIQHNLPPRAATLAGCSTALEVRGASGALEPGRQRLEVACPGEAGWRLTLLSEVEILVPVVFARQPIERGTTLRAEHLELREISLGKSRDHYLAPEPLLGMSSKRRIRAGQQLSSRLVDEPLLVRRGQPLRISASVDGIEASTLGEALEDGNRDQVIRVRNQSSGKTIKARVIEAGVVSSVLE